MIDMSSIGTELRRLRNEHGLTIREVAARAGCSFQMVSALENASIENTSIRTLESIAVALGSRVKINVVDPMSEPDPELENVITSIKTMWPNMDSRARRTLQAMIDAIRAAP